MAKPLPSRAEVARCLNEAPRSMHAREIAAQCNVDDAAYPRFLELLTELAFDGTVRKLPGNRYKAGYDPGGQGSGWEGVLSVNPRGFGFVTASGLEDVYVAPEGIGGAMHGDRVRIQVIARTARGVEGRIHDILQRRNTRIAGLLHKRKKSIWLEPDDTRVRGPIVITSALVEGNDGDAAVVKITSFPKFADETAEGELIAVLGVQGDPNAEVAKILVREQIEETHPDAAMQEAERMAARLKTLPPMGRVDLRSVPLPTIDPEDARDHDDAIWVERTPEGYRAWVAIADVSEYVQPGSALDEEAVARGCTIYLPDRAIPMLPAALAADLCSLLPDHDRLCLCVIADLDKHGKVERFEIVEGIMRSSAMLTYGGVARALGFSDIAPRSAQAERMARELKVLDELAGKLRRARMKRGALDLDLPEARVVIDPQTGAPAAIQRRAQDPGIKRAYGMVEELMLLANELVAQWLTERRSPAVYRVHAKPDEAKLERLGEVAQILAVEFDFDRMLEPNGVSKWLAQIADHEKKPVLEMLLLRSLKQAAYDIVNVGHFGLASDNYLHFTSPIRRYPDVLVHRAVKRLLRGEKPDTSASAVELLRASATQASVRERAAIDVEREVVDLYRALFARSLVGEEFEGTVTGVVGTGLYVALDDPFLDVLVRYESMGPDRYEATEHELGVVGVRSGDQIMIGDRVLVTIEDVALLRRAVYARRAPPPEAFRGGESPGRRGNRKLEWSKGTKGAGAKGSKDPKRGKGRRESKPEGSKEQHVSPRKAKKMERKKDRKRTARAPSTRGKRQR